jgi:methyl-accepting chemotaxis protein
VKFRRRGTAILVFASIITILAITAIANFLTTRLLEEAKEENYKLMRDVLASVRKSTEDRALNRAEIIANMNGPRDALAARDRGKLLEECARMFKIQDEKYGVNIGQFHTPPGIAFLKLHKPDKFGDDETGYRPMVTDVNMNHVIRQGLGITKTGPAISGIVPVTDDAGKHVGSFEIGMELPPMLDKIKEAYNIEAAVFIDEKQLKDLATDLGGDILTPKNRVGRYIRFYATHPDLAASLVTDKEVEILEPFHFDRTVAGTLWGVQLVPMYTYNGKQIGVYALAINQAQEKAGAGRARVWQLLSALFAIVMLAGLILVIVRGMLLAPVESLGLRMKALADGDPSQPADDLDTYADEVRPLAESYERLRKEKQS